MTTGTSEQDVNELRTKLAKEKEERKADQENIKAEMEKQLGLSNQLLLQDQLKDMKKT